MINPRYMRSTSFDKELQFWVLSENSIGEIEYINIFDSYSLMNFLNTQKKRYPTRHEFDEMLETVIRYYFWGKCEHEILVYGWPQRAQHIKLDKFEQLIINWHLFEPLCWNYVSKNWKKNPEEYKNRPKPDAWARLNERRTK